MYSSPTVIYRAAYFLKHNYMLPKTCYTNAVPLNHCPVHHEIDYITIVINVELSTYLKIRENCRVIKNPYYTVKNDQNHWLKSLPNIYIHIYIYILLYVTVNQWKNYIFNHDDTVSISTQTINNRLKMANHWGTVRSRPKYQYVVCFYTV